MRRAAIKWLAMASTLAAAGCRTSGHETAGRPAAESSPAPRRAPILVSDGGRVAFGCPGGRMAPVTFVGLFHSKPRGTESDWATARRRGADDVLGYDPLWTTLEAWYGERLGRSPTSVTFVLDREGRFAFIHPGPVFQPSRHPDHARCDADYHAVRAGILEALGEDVAP